MAILETTHRKNRRRVGFLLFVAGLLAPMGCDDRPAQPSAASELAAVAFISRPARRAAALPHASVPRFREVAREAGLNYQWSIPGKRPLTILQTIGNGCAFLDYDNDGNLDILLVGPKLALYKGDGHGHFTDVTHQTGLDRLHGHFLGCAVGDYDNDGWPDLYISGWHTGLLLHNEEARREDGGEPGSTSTPPDASALHIQSASVKPVIPTPSSRVFRDVTREVGLRPQPWGTSCGFADLDGDGYLDLYVCNYADYSPNSGLQLCPFHGVLTGCGPRDYDALRGTLYHNEGGKHFRDVTKAWGAVGTGKALGVAFASYAPSHRLGFAVANDLMAGDLFQNLGKGKFLNISQASGTALDEAGEVHAGMGIDWGDYDNDGRPDLFVTTFAYESKCLYHNEGAGLFSIARDDAGLLKPTLPYVGWGCKFFDADNDGWLDLILANGHVQDNISRFEDATYRQPVQFLHNTHGPRVFFTDATRSAGLGSLPLLVGRGVAVGDYDNDGRVDVLVVDSEGRPLLLHNESLTPENGWIGFRLIGGQRSNRDAYGAETQVTAGKQKWIRQCHPGGSYLSSSDPRVHFGLGSATPDLVTVRWPDGVVQSWTHLTPGRYWTLREGEPPERLAQNRAAP